MEEQAKLYPQGRLGYIYDGKNYSDLSKPRLTNAMRGQSYHNKGPREYLQTVLQVKIPLQNYLDNI
ncbi:hypothetical protein AAEY33_13045 [Peribacillus simplex]|uniref:hypothetical protein n=1 Tax=Peribacillus simplex TaxID=1478 RepID=UPI0032668E21